MAQARAPMDHVMDYYLTLRVTLPDTVDPGDEADKLIAAMDWNDLDVVSCEYDERQTPPGK